jgi:amino acid transporter
LRGRLVAYHPFAFALPSLSLSTPGLFSKHLNIFSKLALGALTGFEYVAILAGECRTPARNIGRSVIIAAPIIALMFILGTSSVLGLIPIDQIDLIAPIPQVLAVGYRPFGVASLIAPVMIAVLLCVRVAQASVMFTGNTRMPMVAGWDGLLPAWFTTLHARYRTPVNSILFVGGATFAFGIAGLIGVGKQEAFQLLWNASATFYGMTYLVMFAIPIAGLRGSARPPLWVRLASMSGFLMTLLNVVLAIVPIVQVENRLAFALKLLALVAVTNAIGFAIFQRSRNRGTF